MLLHTAYALGDVRRRQRLATESTKSMIVNLFLHTRLVMVQTLQFYDIWFEFHNLVFFLYQQMTVDASNLLTIVISLQVLSLIPESFYFPPRRYLAVPTNSLSSHILSWDHHMALDLNH